jgi:hypothetical protein
MCASLSADPEHSGRWLEDMLVGGCGHGPPRCGTDDEEVVVERRGAGVVPRR